MGFNRSYLTSSAGDWIFSKMTVEQIREKYFPEVSAQDFQNLMSIDPTYKPETGYAGQLSRFLLDRYKSGAISLDSDALYAWEELLKEYWEAKQTKAVKFDILTMKNMPQLRDALALSRSNEYDVLFDGISGGKQVLVVHTKTHKANMFFACSERWCTANSSGTYWGSYSGRGPLVQAHIGATLSDIASIKNAGKRFQIHTSRSGEYMEIEDQGKTPYSVEDFLHTIGPQAAQAVEAFFFKMTGESDWTDFRYADHFPYTMTPDGSEEGSSEDDNEDDEEPFRYFEIDIRDRAVRFRYSIQQHGDEIDSDYDDVDYETLGDYAIDEYTAKDYEVLYELDLDPFAFGGLLQGSITSNVIDGYLDADDTDIRPDFEDLSPMLWMYAPADQHSSHSYFTDHGLRRAAFPDLVPFRTSTTVGFYDKEVRTSFSDGVMAMLYHDRFADLGREFLTFISDKWELDLEDIDSSSIGANEFYEKYIVPKAEPVLTLSIPSHLDKYDRNSNKFPYRSRRFHVSEQMRYKHPADGAELTFISFFVQVNFRVADAGAPYLVVNVDKDSQFENMYPSDAMYTEILKQIVEAAKDVAPVIYVANAGPYSLAAAIREKLVNLGAKTVLKRPEGWESTHGDARGWLDVSSATVAPQPKQPDLFLQEAVILENSARDVVKYMDTPYKELMEAPDAGGNAFWDYMTKYAKDMSKALYKAYKAGIIPESGSTSKALKILELPTALKVFKWARDGGFRKGYTGYSIIDRGEGDREYFDVDYNELGSYAMDDEGNSVPVDD